MKRLLIILTVCIILLGSVQAVIWTDLTKGIADILYIGVEERPDLSNLWVNNTDGQLITKVEDHVVNITGPIVYVTNISPQANNTGSIGAFENRFQFGYFDNLTTREFGGYSPIIVTANLNATGQNITGNFFVGECGRLRNCFSISPWTNRTGPIIPSNGTNQTIISRFNNTGQIGTASILWFKGFFNELTATLATFIEIIGIKAQFNDLNVTENLTVKDTNCKLFNSDNDGILQCVLSENDTILRIRPVNLELGKPAPGTEVSNSTFGFKFAINDNVLSSTLVPSETPFAEPNISIVLSWYVDSNDDTSFINWQVTANGLVFGNPIDNPVVGNVINQEIRIPNESLILVQTNFTIPILALLKSDVFSFELRRVSAPSGDPLGNVRPVLIQTSAVFRVSNVD